MGERNRIHGKSAKARNLQRFNEWNFCLFTALVHRPFGRWSHRINNPVRSRLGCELITFRLPSLNSTDLLIKPPPFIEDAGPIRNGSGHLCDFLLLRPQIYYCMIIPPNISVINVSFVITGVICLERFTFHLYASAC